MKFIPATALFLFLIAASAAFPGHALAHGGHPHAEDLQEHVDMHLKEIQDGKRKSGGNTSDTNAASMPVVLAATGQK